MSLRATCPTCGKTYAIEPELAGKIARCRCGRKFKIPEDTLGDADLLDDAPANDASVEVLLPGDIVEDTTSAATAARQKAVTPAIVIPFGGSVADPPPLPRPTTASAPPSIQAPCRNCRSSLASGAVICPRCGMNQHTGQMAKNPLSTARREVAQRAYTPQRSGSGNRSGMGNIVLGVVLIIIGGAVTLGTLTAAQNNGGGTYIVAYGPIGFGIWRVIKGLSQMASGE